MRKKEAIFAIVLGVLVFAVGVHFAFAWNPNFLWLVGWAFTLLLIWPMYRIAELRRKKEEAPWWAVLGLFAALAFASDALVLVFFDLEAWKVVSNLAAHAAMVISLFGFIPREESVDVARERLELEKRRFEWETKFAERKFEWETKFAEKRFALDFAKMLPEVRRGLEEMYREIGYSPEEARKLAEEEVRRLVKKFLRTE